ncbi:MAG: GrpB family protein [Clostridia bacterium]|nr:GrpB family protein [Clostridia bacterium]
MLGLKRGTVRLEAHRDEWEEEAGRTIVVLKNVFGSAAAGIEHVGSTAVPGICTKPIIDIAVGMKRMQDVDACIPALREAGIIDRGEDIPGQRLLVIGDFERDTRSHHIHAVLWNSEAWHNYIRLRDFLRSSMDAAKRYEALKQALAIQFAQDRKAYTEGKKAMIEQMIHEANECAAQPKAMLICGRIACGKTVYAQRLCGENRAVNLSCDELMLGVFGDTLGMKFDEVSGRCKRYLYDKALELLACGTNVVLDWGFWSPAERRYARKMFTDAGFACEMHYVAVSSEVWKKNIAVRNELVAKGECRAYPVDDGLLKKLEAGFHEPDPEEIDVWYDNCW